MSEQAKRLYRSRDERMIAGVCGGLGEYLNTDPTVIRILFFVIILISFGAGLVLYLAMWLIVPEEPFSTAGQYPAPEPTPKQPDEGSPES
jgi:phage shock protein C